MKSRRFVRALEDWLAAGPGPVSITAGIAALRIAGARRSDEDLQTTVASFAAERGRPILFDRSCEIYQR